ncbi:MAG: alpha/beta fold hydrolase [Deltaproteobacteria bacterium]|nr:alpha/beta fold hydrolase [Deltaproteobacteria bacterium]
MGKMTLFKIVSWTFFAYIAYCCLLFIFQRLILFPRYQIPTPPEKASEIPGLEEIRLKTSFGKVEAWFIPATTKEIAKPAPVVIFAHGNAELIDFWPEELRQFTSIGLAIFLVEYPGYGRSDGSPSQEQITESFVAAYDHIIKRNDVDPTQIVLFGRSLGGGVVCALAAKRPCAALILMSTFTSTRSFANKFLIPSILILDPFDNLKFIESFSGPTLIIHGRNDDLVPYRHGVRLHRAAKHSKMLTYDCNHNDCPPNWNRFWQDVESFLVKNLTK